MGGGLRRRISDSMSVVYCHGMTLVDLEVIYKGVEGGYRGVSGGGLERGERGLRGWVEKG